MHTLLLETGVIVKPINLQLNEAGIAMVAKQHKERAENRHIVLTIFDVVCHLAEQNRAFRGHDEIEDSLNRGKLLKSCSFFQNTTSPCEDGLKNILET